MILCCFWGVEHFQTKQAKQDLVTDQYMSAIEQTRLNLSLQIEKAKLRIQSFNYSDQHAIKAFASFFVHQGQVDQFEVFDDKTCQLLSKATLEKRIEHKCHKEGIREGYSWFQSIENKPVLGFQSVLGKHKNQPKVVFIAKVVLNQEWLKQFPNLKSGMAHANMKIGSYSDAGDAIYKLGKNAEDVFTASLFHDSFLSKWNVQYDHVVAIFKIILVSLLFLIVFIYFHTARSNLDSYENLLRRAGEFHKFCKNLFKNFSNPSHNTNASIDFMYLDQNFKDWCEELEEIQLTESKRNKDVLLDYNQKKQECINLSEKVKLFKRLASSASKNNGLNENISQFAPVLIKSHHDISKYINGKMISDIKEIHKYMIDFRAVITSWDYGFRELGSRKYIRSLCERPSAHGAKHLLDENITSLIHSSAQIFAKIKSFEKNLEDVLDRGKFEQKVLSFWHDLSSEDELKSKCKHKYKVEESLDFVKTLFKSLNHNLSINFATSHEVKRMELQWPPKSIFISLMERVLRLLLGNDRDQQYHILIKHKSQKGFFNLFISIPRKELFKEILVDSENWSEIKNLIGPYDMEANLIPNGENFTTVSVSWPIKEEASTAKSLRKTQNKQVQMSPVHTSS